MRKVDFRFISAAYMQQAQVAIGDKTLSILSGNDDDIVVYQDKHNYYVLSENHRMDYIGLERFDKTTLEREFDIFMQQESDDKDWLLRISRYPTKIRYMLQWDM